MGRDMIECFKCEKTMNAKVAVVPGQYHGEEFRVETEAMVCDACGFTTVDRPQLGEFYLKVADAYREKHNLLPSQEIRNIRKRLGHSQKEFAHFICVGEASVKRWETGKVQDPAKDRLIKLQTDAQSAEENYIRILFKQGGPRDEFSGWVHFNIEKFEQTVLFFLQQMDREKLASDVHVPKVINKLAWFSDAEHVRTHGKSITGTRYARITDGPVPDEYVRIYRFLEEEKIIQYRDPETLVPLQDFDPEPFSAEEISTLNTVWERFRNKLDSIVGESHKEKAWKETGYARPISFKLV